MIIATPSKEKPHPASRLGQILSAAIYMDGDKRASCPIWMPNGNSFGGDIAYARGERSTGGINESMSINDDGYKPWSPT